MANDMTPEQLFTEARSFKFFSDKPVGEDQLRALYDVAKFAPRRRTPVRCGSPS